jgi:hypothetical protein
MISYGFMSSIVFKDYRLSLYACYESCMAVQILYAAIFGLTNECCTKHFVTFK